MGMRTIIESVPSHLTLLIKRLRSRLQDAAFIARHRVRPQDFTRKRDLTFPILMLCVLQKTVKSIQRHLRELLDELTDGRLSAPLTAGAFTHARAKLKHTAFIELNDQVLLPLVAESAVPLKRWRGHRLFGHDSSLLRLPYSEELVEVFGVVEVTNNHGTTGTRYPEARMAVLYDLLNHFGVNARLESSRVGEVELAIEQAACLSPGDVVINDRGFTGFRYLAEHVRRGLQVIGRCSTGSFWTAQELFRQNLAQQSVITILRAPEDDRAEFKRLGLPVELKVRFVSLRLPDGKLEVLVTTLLEETRYPTGEFLEVYHWRWPHETYYSMLKGRLDLENFSGKTAEAVRQDFHATVLLCNLETVLIQPAAVRVQEQSIDHKYPKKVNQADAYHALKDQLLELLYSDTPAEEVVRKLQSWFMGNPIPVRLDRKIPRRKQSFHRSYHFQRNVRKIVF